jgi:hypothetical protein
LHCARPIMQGLIMDLASFFSTGKLVERSRVAPYIIPCPSPSPVPRSIPGTMPVTIGCAFTLTSIASLGVIPFVRFFASFFSMLRSCSHGEVHTSGLTPVTTSASTKYPTPNSSLEDPHIPLSPILEWPSPVNPSTRSCVNNGSAQFVSSTQRYAQSIQDVSERALFIVGGSTTYPLECRFRFTPYIMIYLDRQENLETPAPITNTTYYASLH